MEIKNHPTFEKRRSDLIGVFVLCYSVPFMLWIFVFQEFSYLIFFSFGIVFLCCFVYFGWVMFRNIDCPRCNKKTITKELKNEEVLVAVCENCRIKWNLGERFSGAGVG